MLEVDKSKEVSPLQPENIELILVTFEVSKGERSRVDNLLQL